MCIVKEENDSLAHSCYKIYVALKMEERGYVVCREYMQILMFHFTVDNIECLVPLRCWIVANLFILAPFKGVCSNFVVFSTLIFIFYFSTVQIVWFQILRKMAAVVFILIEKKMCLTLSHGRLCEDCVNFGQLLWVTTLLWKLAPFCL